MARKAMKIEEPAHPEAEKELRRFLKDLKKNGRAAITRQSLRNLEALCKSLPNIDFNLKVGKCNGQG